jgi:hypothetical protein
MKNKKILLIAALFALAASNAGNAFAQSVTFGYDAAGNRISRTVLMSAPQAAPRAAEASQEPFVEQLAADLQVKIYPNPTKGILQVELTGIEDDDETPQIAVFGINGTMLWHTNATSTLNSVDLSQYPAGVYVLKLTIRGKQTDYKIIKN